MVSKGSQSTQRCHGTSPRDRRVFLCESLRYLCVLCERLKGSQSTQRCHGTSPRDRRVFLCESLRYLCVLCERLYGIEGHCSTNRARQTNNCAIASYDRSVRTGEKSSQTTAKSSPPAAKNNVVRRPSHSPSSPPTNAPNGMSAATVKSRVALIRPNM